MNALGLAGIAHKAKFLMNENMPTILTGVGVVGTGATAYLTGRASFKAARLLDHNQIMHYEQTGGEEPSKMQKVKLVWRHYIPPATVMTGTMAAIVMANKVSSRRIAALALASGITERAFSEYKEKVYERLGKGNNEKIREEIARDRILKNPHDTTQVIITGNGDVLCYDMLTGRYFLSSAEKLRKAENRVNKELNNFMYASLSLFYEEVGLPPTTYTDTVGWQGNENLEVNLTTVLSDDEKPCLAVDFTPLPTSDYTKRLYD
jgi:hypothetical protein